MPIPSYTNNLCGSLRLRRLELGWPVIAKCGGQRKSVKLWFFMLTIFNLWRPEHAMSRKNDIQWRTRRRMAKCQGRWLMRECQVYIPTPKMSTSLSNPNGGTHFYSPQSYRISVSDSMGRAQLDLDRFRLIWACLLGQRSVWIPYCCQKGIYFLNIILYYLLGFGYGVYLFWLCSCWMYLVC